MIFVSRSVLMWKTNLDLNFAFLVNICSSCNYSVLHCLFPYVGFSMTNPLTDCLFMLVYCYWKTSILDVSIMKCITPVYKYTMACLFKKVQSRILFNQTWWFHSLCFCRKLSRYIGVLYQRRQQNYTLPWEVRLTWFKTVLQKKKEKSLF